MSTKFSSRKLKKRRTGCRVVAFIVLLLCGVVSYKRVELETKVVKVSEELDNKKQLLEAQKKRAKEIEEYRVYVHTNKYVEQVAREKMGLVYKNEIVFKSED